MMEKNWENLLYPPQGEHILEGKQVPFQGNEFDNGGACLRDKKMLLQQDTEGAELGGWFLFSVMMPCDKSPRLMTTSSQVCRLAAVDCPGWDSALLHVSLSQDPGRRSSDRVRHALLRPGAPEPKWSGRQI